jgi:hypothetical protein
MTLQAVSRPIWLQVRELPVALTSTIMDAAGESTSMIGQVWLSSGPGTSKTISSAGGKIYFTTTASTFANAGSTLRVGLQDVDGATGLEDGTFDVHDDLVPGTDTVTAAAVTTATMSSGSKTITHGDIVALSIEWTARAGSDSIRPSVVANVAQPDLANFPYSTTDTGSGPAKSNNVPYATIEFDDGTIGTFGPMTPLILAGAGNQVAFNSGSTPDEYAMVFQVPFRCEVSGLSMGFGEVDAGESGEVLLYSDPLGTPVAERTVTVDPEITSVAASVTGLAIFAIAAYTLEVNTNYAVAYKATSAGSRTLQMAVVPTANSRVTTPFGTTVQGGQRSDATGAFSTLNSTTFPLAGLVISKLDDGAGGGTTTGGTRPFRVHRR